MKNTPAHATKTWAVVVVMSVLAATAVMAQQPGELPEQTAACAAMQLIAADDGSTTLKTGF